jgi:tetratricopeptide (TPR) repeat protein
VSALVRRILAVLALVAVLVPAAAAAETAFERGVASYRSGDYAAARDHWHAALAEPLGAHGRARVYYDLGNAHWRLGEELRAIACWETTLRLVPGHRDARTNLELARAKASLPPAEAGDLAATVTAALDRLSAPVERGLVFAALVLWAAVLVLEIRSGGPALRAALAGATLLLVLAAVPWVHGLLAGGDARAAPMLVVASGQVPLRSEPLETRDAIGALATLEEVERVDQLPGWVRVQRADGTRGWVRDDALFALDLGARSSDGG